MSGQTVQEEGVATGKNAGHHPADARMVAIVDNVRTAGFQVTGVEKHVGIIRLIEAVP